MAKKKTGSSRIMGFRISPDLDTALRNAAKTRDVSQSQVVEEALRSKLFGGPDKEEVLFGTLFYVQEMVSRISGRPSKELKETLDEMTKRARDLLSAKNIRD